VRHNGPTVPARIGIVLLLISITLVTPESAQLFVEGCLAILVLADVWWERRGVRRVALPTNGLPAGRHRESKTPAGKLLR
jgi:hypothetical protein